MNLKIAFQKLQQYQLQDRLFTQMRIVISLAALGFYFYDSLLNQDALGNPYVEIMLLLFLLWTGMILWRIHVDSKIHSRQSRKVKRFIIGISLPIDLCFIYYTTFYTDGLNSPFFIAIFVLIVFHAYYFPTYLPRLASTGWGWSVSGASAGTLGFIFIYSNLHHARPLMDLHFLASCFFALILGMTACILRNNDLEINRSLLRADNHANLFRGVIKRVNKLYSSNPKSEGSDHDNLNELAATIGENLSASSCEVFLRQDKQTFIRKGKWIRPNSSTSFRSLYNRKQRIIYKAGTKRIWVGRYTKGQIDFSVEKNELALVMKVFLNNPLVRHSLFTLILRRDPNGKMIPIGMLRVTNRIENSNSTVHTQGFSDEDEKIIETVAKRISPALDNYRLQERLTRTVEKEKQLRQIALKDDLDEVIREILISMSNMVNARHAELWTPFDDGFERKQKLVLRAHYPLKGHVAEKLSESERFISIDESYIGSLIQQKKQQNEIVYKEDIRDVQDYAWTHFLKDFGTYKIISILLVGEKDLLGVAYLHPSKDFEWDEKIRLQLQEFAELATVSIERARYSRRFQQIRKIQSGIDRLLVIDENSFYRNVTDLVREIIPAEACSIFSVDLDKKTLTLRGSSDKTSSTQSRVGKTFYHFDGDSYAGRVAKTGQSVTAFGDFNKQEQQFIEHTSSTASSLMISPICDTKNNVIGVIRCVNKAKNPNIVTKTFSQSDLELLGFTVSFIAVLLENRTNLVRLETLIRQRQGFMSSVAHEFTSPLQSIRSTTEALKRFDNNSARQHETVSQFDFVIEEIDFLNYLIANIRTLFDDDFDSFRPSEIAKIDLFKLVAKIQTLLKGQAQEKGIDIELQGASLAVMIDKFHLEQVIFNLLTNAIKYTRPATEKPIEIICKELPNQVHLVFKNWGIGIRKSEEVSIFDIYKRGQQAHALSVSGTGLGLYISRKIMRNLGGDLKLTRLENPTEFTAYLPKV